MVKRYFVTQTADLEEDAKGDWVRASDYAAIESKLGECEQALFDAGRLHGETLRTLADERSRLDAAEAQIDKLEQVALRDEDKLQNEMARAHSLERRIDAVTLVVENMDLRDRYTIMLIHALGGAKVVESENDVAVENLSGN